MRTRVPRESSIGGCHGLLVSPCDGLSRHWPTSGQWHVPPVHRSRHGRDARAARKLRGALAAVVLCVVALAPVAALGGTGEAAEKVGRGIAHFRAGDFKKAGKAFTEADVARPDDPWIAFDRACAHAAQGELDKAEGLFEQSALSRDLPLAVRSHYNLGSLAAEKARALFGEKPQDASPETRSEGLGLLLEAVGHFRDCLKLDASHADARHNLEVIRLWIKHMEALWEERDRQKKRQEMGLLEFLQMIEAQQRMLRTAAKSLADERDSPRRRQALVTAESSQRTLAEEIEPLKEKIKAALEPAGQAAPPGQQAKPQAAPGVPPEAAKKALEVLTGLANQSRQAMLSAADRLHGGSVDEAVDSETEAIANLDQIYQIVVPFPNLVQRAVATQQGLVDLVAPAAQNPDEHEALDSAETAWSQRFVAGWAEVLAPKAGQGLKNLGTIGPGAIAKSPPGGAQPGAPDPEAMKKQMEALRRSMEKAVELGPKVKTLTDEAAAELDEEKPAEALPKQEEALRLLKEIAEPLPKQEQPQQGDQGKDQQPKDQQKEKQGPGGGRKQQPQPQPRDLSQRQAEAVLRKVRDRQRERQRLEKQLQRQMYRPGAVERDW